MVCASWQGRESGLESSLLGSFHRDGYTAGIFQRLPALRPRYQLRFGGGSLPVFGLDN